MLSKTILYDSPKAKKEREQAPSYGYCIICGRPWKYVTGHSIKTIANHGCFAQCEDCWKKASDHDIQLCNEILYHDWLSMGIPEEKIGFSKEFLMKRVDIALEIRRINSKIIKRYTNGYEVFYIDEHPWKSIFRNENATPHAYPEEDFVIMHPSGVVVMFIKDMEQLKEVETRMNLIEINKDGNAE